MVAVGAASGVTTMAFLIALLFYCLPSPQGMEELPARIAFALRMNMIALLSLLIGIVTVANRRFLGEAIDPPRHAEDRATEIDGRMVDNTVQQTIVFCAGTMALSTLLDKSSIKLVAALAIVFILVCAAFWIGYRINPPCTAPGMAATGYLNFGIVLAVFYLLLR